jgi:hypothetical protein
MSIDESEELNMNKKAVKSPEEAIKMYKIMQKRAKLKRIMRIMANNSPYVKNFKSRLTPQQNRAEVIRAIGSKAEILERQIIGFNEVGFLNNLESARMKALSPPNDWLRRTEADVLRSFPD